MPPASLISCSYSLHKTNAKQQTLIKIDWWVFFINFSYQIFLSSNWNCSLHFLNVSLNTREYPLYMWTSPASNNNSFVGNCCSQNAYSIARNRFPKHNSIQPTSNSNLAQKKRSSVRLCALKWMPATGKVCKSFHTESPCGTIFIRSPFKMKKTISFWLFIHSFIITAHKQYSVHVSKRTAEIAWDTDRFCSDKYFGGSPFIVWWTGRRLWRIPFIFFPFSGWDAKLSNNFVKIKWRIEQMAKPRLGARDRLYRTEICINMLFTTFNMYGFVVCMSECLSVCVCVCVFSVCSVCSVYVANCVQRFQLS